MAKFGVGDLRNIAFAGHGAVGKTTLLEALLFLAKVTDRKGSVEEGTSLFDFDDEEKARKYSIDSALCPLDWKGKRFHFIDTPGYPDFLGQAISAIHNVETAAIVIDAHRGIEVNTRRLFDEANRAGVARVIVLNKLDSDNVRFDAVITRIQETFGKECVLLQSPVGLGHGFSSVLNLLHLPASLPAGAVGDPAALREALIERIVETNDSLLERFLEGELPDDTTLAQTLVQAVAAGQLVPILCVSGKRDVGLEELLDTLVEVAPSPADGLKRSATHNGGAQTLEPEPAKPFVGRVFKALADKFGNLTYFRVFQGSIKPNSTVKLSRDGSAHRLGPINLARGKALEKLDEAGPGDFVCVAKLEGVQINDTLSEDGTISLPPVKFPKPMFPLAVGAKARGDDVKILQSLRKVVHEDPCFVIHRDEQTNETIMNGLSQLHLEVVQSRLRTRDGLELVTHEPKVPYKETVSRPGEGMYRHKKQTGGRGQFAEVHLRLKPLERGAGFEFIDSIVGGVIPGQYIPAVEKGVRETMTQGVLCGCEVVDLAAEVFFGKYHDVDSSEQAFKYASSMAFKEAFAQCAPILLEPIVTLEVAVPSEKMGDINSDLNTRRAQITGMDTLPGGLQVVKANVPLAEVLRYQTELKSMTGGQGSFSMEFSHLAPVPPNIQQQIVEKYKRSKTEAASA
jgi:elongation factor G